MVLRRAQLVGTYCHVVMTDISQVLLSVDKCRCVVLHDTMGSITLNLNLIYCSWLNRNKKPQNSEKLFYFTKIHGCRRISSRWSVLLCMTPGVRWVNELRDTRVYSVTFIKTKG